MTLHKIDLYDREFTVLYHEEHGGITVLRHGEPWSNETGKVLILALVQKVLEQEEFINRLELELEEVTEDRNTWRSNSLDWDGEDEEDY